MYQSLRVVCCDSFPRRQCRFSIRAVAIASAANPVRTFVRTVGLPALARKSLAIEDPCVLLLKCLAHRQVLRPDDLVTIVEGSPCEFC